MNEFGIKMQPSFIDVNKEQISVYFPEHENIWCSDAFIIVKAPKYRVRISYRNNKYVGELYNAQLERELEYGDINKEAYTDEELNPLVAKVTIDKLEQFRDLLYLLYSKIVNADGLLKE